MNQDGWTRSIWNISGTSTIDAAFASTDPFIQAVTGPGTGSTYNFLSGWTGSWTHGTMSGDEWRTYVTTHPEFQLDGASVTTGTFDAGFRVTNSGRTLSLRPPPAPEPPRCSRRISTTTAGEKASPKGHSSPTP